MICYDCGRMIKECAILPINNIVKVKNNYIGIMQSFYGQ